MAEKAPWRVARDTWGNATGPTTADGWQAVACAVIAEYERRRWRVAFANLSAPPKEANDAE